MTTPVRLGVAMTAMNSRRTIARTLESVAGLASLVVVVDSGSTDGSIEICRSYGAVVHEQAWLGYAAQKQRAIDLCTGCDWILLLDSDESLEPDLQQSIAHVLAEDDRRFDGFTLDRKLFFLGAWLHHTLQPDRVLRLVRAGRGRMSGGAVHERLVVDGRTGRVRGVLRHDSWADMRDLGERSVRYAELAASEAGTARHGGTLLNLVISPVAAFVKELLIKGAILDGRRGFIVACANANATLLKHAFIAASRLRNERAEQAPATPVAVEAPASGAASASPR